MTTAGELFLKEAKQIVQRYDSLMERTERLGNGIVGTLRVGYLELFTQNILPTAVRSFRRKFPLVDIQLIELTNRYAQQALLDGSLDLGFLVMRTQNPAWDNELHHQRVYTGQLELVVSANHPYANYEYVSPAVLENEQILTFEANETPELRENIIEMCMKYNFSPHFATGEYTPGAIFLLVQAGMGVTLLSSLITSVLRNENRIRTLKLDCAPFPTNLELAWRHDNHNPCIPNFIYEVQNAAHPENGEVSMK